MIPHKILQFIVGLYLDISVALPKKALVIGKVLITLFLAAGVKDVCWTGVFCTDRECVKSVLGPIYGSMFVLQTLVLIWILIDDEVGWLS